MTLALKEWPATIQALEEGSLIFLIRKGGIHDTNKNFACPGPRAVLFPSYEHQKNECLKASALSTAKAYQVGDEINIQSGVEFIDSVVIRTPEKIPELNPYHIWTNAFLQQRFDWKPERPLVCLFCRTFWLHQPIKIQYHKDYGGCRSFIDVRESVEFQSRQPVITEAEFLERVDDIKHILRPKGLYR